MPPSMYWASFYLEKQTKREIVRKRFTDLIVWKKLASRDDKGSGLSKASREETRRKS